MRSIGSLLLILVDFFELGIDDLFVLLPWRRLRCCRPGLRAGTLLRLPRGPRAAGDLLTVLFGRPIEDPHQTMFAMGEAIAHLNYLESQRRLERTEENGIIRYATLQ